jgi:hypothetical protein
MVDGAAQGPYGRGLAGFALSRRLKKRGPFQFVPVMARATPSGCRGARVPSEPSGGAWSVLCMGLIDSSPHPLPPLQASVEGLVRAIEARRINPAPASSSSP